MEMQRINVQNFKGIINTTIHFVDGSPGNVGTLIGLNESGKTTILEALSHFGHEDRETAAILKTAHQKSEFHNLIPKHQKAAFNGTIRISATLRITDFDIKELEKEFKARKIEIDTTKLLRSIEIIKTYKFEDSEYQTEANTWGVSFSLKQESDEQFLTHNGIVSSAVPDMKLWHVGVNALKRYLPRLIYFPTFLFDIPERIYLSDKEGEVNTYYVKIMQDVLSSLNQELSLKKHINDRIEKLKKLHPDKLTFLSFFFTRDERRQIDAVLQSASVQLSKVILGSWNEIFRKSVSGKRIQIDWSIDTSKDNAVYLEISIFDGDSRFSLAERSLGFRWFFSFLLFTQFRKNRKDNIDTIFLLDEPAANLHSRAQIKLLDSFASIAKGNTYVYYSTHSHYMINPQWLEKAYIVENTSNDYSDEEDIDHFKTQIPNIVAMKYKTFVGKNPTRTSYFQPVLDSLEVTMSPLLGASRALIVEGKNDFYPILYFCKRLLGQNEIKIYPVGGAGHADILISLFRGWNVDFRILLDDDLAGKKAKRRYQEKLLVRGCEVVTLGDISPDFEGKAFECIYADDFQDAVKQKFETIQPSKQEFSLFVQELLMSGTEVEFPDSEDRFKHISAWIDKTFQIAE